MGNLIDKKIMLMSLAIGVGLVAFVGLSIFWVKSQKEIDILVEGRERVVSGKDGRIESDYVVYTDDGIFSIDSDYYFRSLSDADIFGKLQKGHCFKVKTTGWRTRFTRPLIADVISEIPCKTKSGVKNAQQNPQTN